MAAKQTALQMGSAGTAVNCLVSAQQPCGARRREVRAWKKKGRRGSVLSQQQEVAGAGGDGTVPLSRVRPRVGKGRYGAANSEPEWNTEWGYGAPAFARREEAIVFLVFSRRFQDEGGRNRREIHACSGHAIVVSCMIAKSGAFVLEQGQELD